MYEPNSYSFELNPKMMELLAEEFNVDKLTTKFAEAVSGKSGGDIEAEGQAIFGEYGKALIQQAHKLGDEYPDRTYEVLLQAIDKTGGYLRFALVPQRFLEISYLATQSIATLPIVENNSNRLVYKMVDCDIYKGIAEKCSDDVAKMMTCKSACMAMCKTIHKDLDIDANIQMSEEMAKDSSCTFVVKRA